MERSKDYAYGVIPIHTDENGQVLLCLVQQTSSSRSTNPVTHAWEEFEARKWAFPKGHREEGESDEAAARRELYEETGIDDITIIPDPRFTERYSFQLDGISYDKEVVYFLGMVSSIEHETPEAFKSEIADMRWLSYEEARALITFEESKTLLDQVKAYLEHRAIA